MGEKDDPVLETCTLSDRDQTRNVLIVAVNTALSYLAAPVMYVDTIHTALMHQLQQQGGKPRDWVSNLPASAYMVLSVLPLFVAWAFPQIRLLRRILVTCYLSLALVSALVCVVLLLPAPWWIKAALVVVHGAVVGGARTVGVAAEFEALGVGVAPARRGQALALAYGIGPVLAVVGSLLSQLLLDGKIGGLVVGAWPFPGNFAAVFAAGVPVLALGAHLSSRIVIPLPEHEAVREPFLAGVFGGLGAVLRRKVVLVALISAVLVFCGYQVIDNMTLYCGLLLNQEPAQTAGYQKAVLFSCKVVMGLAMGWLLTWAAPRSAVVISATVGLAAVVFALLAPAPVFLFSFGLLGAGQLFGIYITNYVLSCAPQPRMRRYMALCMLTHLPAASAGVLYGGISDFFGLRYSKSVGYQFSLAFAALLILVGLGLALFLPPRPKTEDR